MNTVRTNPLTTVSTSPSSTSSSSTSPTIPNTTTGNLTVRTGVTTAPSVRNLKVLTCTWNAGNARPPTNLDPWIPAKGGHYDIIVVGFQECTFKEKKKKDTSSSGDVSSPGGEHSDEDEHHEEDEENDDTAVNNNAHEQNVDLALLERQITGQAIKSSDASSTSSAVAGTVISKEEEEASENRKHFPTAVARVVMAEAAARNKQEESKNTTDTTSKSSLKSVPAVLNTCAAFDNVKQYLGDQFTLVSSLLMWQIGIMVFARNGTPIDEVETGSEATGLMGITPNKGGVAVKFRVYHTTRLVFIVSHLAAHMKHVSHRNLNAVEIMDNIRFGNTLLDFDSQYHHCFWMGDLNYRIDLALARGGDLNVDNKDRFAEVQEYIKKNDYTTLLQADQLRHAMKQGLAYAGFSESDPTFQPTFKVRRAVDFIYNPQRVSSWCDRVLWKSLPGYKDDVKPLTYAAHPSISTSDHKPVHASFEVNIRPVPSHTLSSGRTS